MKYGLLATTSLVVACGEAAANVSISGFADFGVAGYGGPIDADDTSAKGTNFHRDIQIDFGLSGATMTLGDTNRG